MKKILFLSLIAFYTWQITAQPSWTEQQTGLTTQNDGYVSDIFIVNDQVAWVHASDFDSQGNPVITQQISKTSDGGATWTTVNVSLPNIVNPGIGNICAIDANVAYIAAFKNAIGTPGVFKTVDGGANWTRVSSSNMYADAASFPNFVYFWDADHGMVQGDPVQGEYEIYITNDGGQTWTQVDGANIPNPDAADDYGVVYGYEVAGNTLWFKTKYGNIYRTTDMGNTWTKFSTPLSAVHKYPEFTFKDDNEGWIVKYDDGTLYHTTDGGVTWNQMTPTGTMFKSNIEFIPGTANDLVTCGSSSGNFGSAISHDGGSSWTQIDSESHASLKFLNNTVGYSGRVVAANTEKTVWKWVPDPSAINEKNIEDLKVYPNPATDFVTISTSKTELDKISIFDITGKEVLNMDNLSGSLININTSNIDKGVYLIKVIDKNYAQQTIKLVIK